MVRQATNERRWYITERWQHFDAERRANALRVVAIGAFYTIHLAHYGSSQGRLQFLNFLQLGDAGAVSPRFHASITLLAVVWTMLCLGTMVCLSRKFFPWWLKFFSTGCDLFLLTSILYLGNGPASPMVAGYFLITSLAALRMSLPLVRFATLGCLGGYVCLLGCAKWPESFGKGGLDISIPRYEQLITLLALLFVGLILGQAIRSVPRMAQDFSALRPEDGDQP